MPYKTFLLIFVIGFCVSLSATPLAGRLGVRYGFLDIPGPRRRHLQPTPRLGGLALFLGLMAGMVASLILVERTDPKELTRLVGVFTGLLILLLLGICDDKRELAALPQLLGQVLAASAALLTGLRIGEVANPFGGLLRLPSQLAVLFTLFWIVGMVNTVNWLDGLDGLAAGVTIISSAILFIHTFRLHQYSLAVLPLALAGSALGFLPFNFHPARVFMGTSGSLVLGFALASLAIIGGAKMATTLLVLGIPILDVAWQILSRLRSSRSPLQRDLGHLHYRLSDLGLSQRQVVLLFYGLSAFFGVMALVLRSGREKLYVLLAMGIIIVALLLVLERLPRRGLPRSRS